MATHGWCKFVAPDGPVPGVIDEEERLYIAAEIEVIVARDLYGLTASEMGHVLSTFPIVERRQIEKYGEYRTKRLVLELYGREMANTHPPRGSVTGDP